MAKYGNKAQSKVKRAMHEMKRGELKSGKSGKTVKSRKQAIAIGLSDAREAGAKVPKAKKTTSKTKSVSTKKRTAKKSTPAKRKTAAKSANTSRKSAAKRTTAKRRSWFQRLFA